MKAFFYKYFVLFNLIILAGTTSLNASESPVHIKPLIERSKVVAGLKKIDREKYPDADSVLVHDVQKVTYQADGSAIELDEFYQKILTEKGKRGAEVFSEYFNSSYGTVEILAIEIIKPDGKIIKINAAANSKVMINPAQMGSNIYDPNSKIMKVTVPGVEINDTMRYFVKRSLLVPRMKNIWTDMFVLQSTTPVVYYNIIVDGPKERPLKKYIVKDPVKDSFTFSKKETGDRIIYNWTFRNIPRIFPEPKMPPYFMYTERLLLSTASSWQEISVWYDKLCAPHLKKVTPEMKAKVGELTKGMDSEKEKIDALFRFVSNKIRYMGLTIETNAPGYEPHDIDITFKNRYGVCRDKAALLAGMLRLAGIEAYPVLIMAGPRKDKEVPNNIFNHAITCAVTKSGETVLMDSTDETSRDILPAYLSNKSYLPAKPDGSELLTSPIIPAERNLLQVNTTGEFMNDGSLKAETELKFNGINDNIFRGAFLRWKPEYTKQFFAARLKYIMPGAKITGLKIFPANLQNFKIPLSVKLSFTSKSLLIKGRMAMLMQIPWLASPFSAVSWVLGYMGLKKRQYPLDIGTTCGMVETFSYKLPADFAVIKFPEYEDIDWKKFEWKRKVQADDKILSGSSRYLINAVEFLPDEYLKLKHDIKAIEFQNRKMLVLKKDFAKVSDLKKLFPDAQSVILSQESFIDIKSPAAYSLKQRIKKKILTYAGVKKNSEIKVYYNPAWQEVSVDAVTVTNPDGKKFKLDKTEKNIMDQSWIGSAPRYPAGKILVVNLPGIQPGSLVEYELTIKCSKQPLIDTVSVFQGSMPIIDKRLILSCPEKLALKISPPPECLMVSTVRKDGKIIQEWHAANLNAIPQEIRTPPAWLFAPVVKFSSGDWRKFSKEVKTVIEKCAEKQPETEKLAEKLTAGKLPPDAMKAIRDYVALNIRAAGPGISALPLNCISKADVTLKEAYGNSADRAAVLYAMLKKAGFKPEILLVSTKPAVPEALTEFEKYPGNSFSDVLIRVTHDKKAYFFNDTSQYAELGCCGNEGRIALNLSSGKLGLLNPQSGMESRFDLEYNLKLLEDGSTFISCSKSYYGNDFEAENRAYSEFSPEERRRHFEQMVSALAQSAVPMTKFSSDFKNYPGTVHYAVKIPDYIVSDGKYIYFTLPENDLKYLITTGEDHRVNPYFQGRYKRIKIKYFIELPGNLKRIVIKPENCFIRFPEDGGTISITSKQVSAKRLEIICSVNLKPCIVPADEYGILSNAQATLSKPGLRTIMLEVK